MTTTGERPGSATGFGVAEIRRVALEAWDQGLQCYPAKQDGTKMPDAVTWKPLQVTRLTRPKVEALFSRGRTGVGIFTGTISGNVVLFEFDDLLTYQRYLASAEALGMGDLIKRIETGYVEDTPGQGVHWLIKVPTVRGNTKLASRPKLPEEMLHPNDKTKTLIETRENGGWAVLAPSFGKVHDTGRPYVLRSGSFETIADVTESEQEQLWALAKTFDEMPEPERFQPAKRVGRPTSDRTGERPGDRFEREADWLSDILPGGWAVVSMNGDNQLIRRPGKSKGWSATISNRGDGVLFIFTSSAHPLEPGVCYSKFGAYAALEHAGDFKAATKALAERYGMAAQKQPAGSSKVTRLKFADEGEPVDESDDQVDEIPQINASVQDLRVITAEAWDAICKANEAEPFMFRYGGQPVRVEHDDESRPILRELTVDHVRHLLARVAEFVQVRKNKDDEWETRIVLSPLHVCKDVLVTPNPPLPVVVRVTECPIFGPDGMLRTEPGYDASSRTYLAIPPEVDIPAVPDTPSTADVVRAKALILDDVLGDFPFATEADRANVVGLGLEPFVRSMIAGPMPMHGIEGPVPGSGKGLLAEAMLRPSCGRNIAAFPQAKDDDEWRKRLTSTFERGYPAIQIDNVNKPLESGSLAMALTINIWTDRVLGTAKIISVPVRNSWVLTANNPTYSTEMARRTVRTRIDPKVDRPQEREGWRHAELLSWVDEHRGELIWAFCVLVKSWMAAGRPDFTGKALGSYERWSHVIGGILDHAGITGFLANQGAFYELADVEASAWRSFVAGWWEKHGSNEVGTADLFPLALDSDGFDLGGGNEKSQKTRFGKLLGKQRDRVIGDYRVTPTSIRHKTQRWCLLPSGGDVGDVGGGFYPLLHASARVCACVGMCVGHEYETYADVPNVPPSDESDEPVEKPAVWRCPKCTGFERTVFDDGSWKCDGCGAKPPTCEFCRRAPAMDGATGCSACEGIGT